jgi:uncharacterized protein DUF6600
LFFYTINQTLLKSEIMKTIQRTIILLLLFIGIIGLPPQKATAQVSVSFQLFYDNLSVHGNWVNDPNYGYVWAPNVGVGFAPYRTNGYWVYTEYGWTWVSNYSWGWAPFHYGRWFYDPYYGWLWAPDTQWAPAWVTWRYYDGYYGWAAIGPGVSINIAFGNSYSVPYNQWVFVRERDVCRKNLSSYYVNNSNNTTIINNSTVINNIQTGNGVQYNAGPSRDHVRDRAGTAIAQANLKDRDKPGQKITKNELQLYKPRVEKGNAAPAKVMDRKDVKPVSERKAETKVERQPQKTKEARMEQPTRKERKTEQRQQEMQRKEQGIREQRQQEMQRNEQRVKEEKQRIEQRQQEIKRNEERQLDLQRNEQRKQEIKPYEERELDLQRNEQRIKEQQRSEQPTRVEPQIRRQQMPQRGNNLRQRPIRVKPERNEK